LISQNIEVPSIVDCSKNGSFREREIFKYEKIKCDILIYNHKIFHKKCVIHIFAGSWTNGWKEQRDKLLK
jgi:hypothetical protein